MPREPETYRLNIEQLNTRYPDRELFTRLDIMTLTGVKRDTIAKEFPFKGKYISKVNLAYMLSQKGVPTCLNI